MIKSKIDVNALGIFRSRNRTLVFLVIALNTKKEFYVRSMEKQLMMPAAVVHRELRNLEKAGLVTSRKMANLVLYKAYTKNKIYPEVKNILLKTIGIQELLKPIFDPEAKILTSFFFGSYAKGTLGDTSDIDLMVITSDSFTDKDHDKLKEGVTQLEEMLGREISVDFWQESSFKETKNEGDEYLSKVLAGEKVFVKGGEEDL